MFLSYSKSNHPNSPLYLSEGQEISLISGFVQPTLQPIRQPAQGQLCQPVLQQDAFELSGICPGYYPAKYSGLRIFQRPVQRAVQKLRWRIIDKNEYFQGIESLG